MTLNTFIAVVCVVGAIMLTIAHIRFFFGEEAHKQQGELFHQPPHDEAAPVSAGDTLRTRRRDNAADLRILRKQIIVGAALTLVVVIPILIHTFAPHCPLGPLVDPWWQAVLITPVMFYSGYPVHVDGWSSLVDRRPNMNTLASIGTIAAYAYGLLICFAGNLFPAGMRMSYFAIVGIMITLVLLARLVSDLYLPRQPAFPLQLWVDRFSFVFVPVVIMIALWTFVAWLLFGRQPALPMALLTAISVLIIACPCALGWAATLAAVFANENAGRHGLQIHSLGSLQIARHLTDVLFAQEAASRRHKTFADSSRPASPLRSSMRTPWTTCSPPWIPCANSPCRSANARWWRSWATARPMSAFATPSTSRSRSARRRRAKPMAMRMSSWIPVRPWR